MEILQKRLENLFIKILNRITLLLNKLLSNIKSIYYSNYVNTKTNLLPIKFLYPLKLNINKGINSKLIINNKLFINSYMGGKEEIYIRLGKNSKLIIDGEFSIGNGTQIYVEDNATLSIGGKENESLSGITEKTRIMVNKNIHIGKDVLISWDVFITDCDWHSIDGQNYQSDVYIGDHTWIASGVKILKGSNISNNTIIATNSILSNRTYDANSIVAGYPAKIVKHNISWSRDL